MTKCLVKELTSLIKLSGIGTVTSVYFGGGEIVCVLQALNEYILLNSLPRNSKSCKARDNTGCFEHH